MSKTQPEPRPFVEDLQAGHSCHSRWTVQTTEAKDGTYHIQFVCATPGSYEINAFVDGNKLPMCLWPQMKCMDVYLIA